MDEMLQRVFFNAKSLVKLSKKIIAKRNYVACIGLSMHHLPILKDRVI